MDFNLNKIICSLGRFGGSMNKKLIGKSVYLSPIEVTEAIKYAKWMNDEQVSAKLITRFTFCYNIDAEIEAIKEIQKKDQAFSIYLLQNDIIIGGCSLNHIDYIHRNCEYGICIGETEHWGKGYGSEVTALLMRYAFNYLNINYIGLSVMADNTRAIKCYEKSGFRILGKRKSYLFIDGNYTDLLLMECTIADYHKYYKDK